VAISFAVENDIRQLTNIENSIGQVIPVATEQPFHKEFSKAPIQNKKKKQVKKSNRRTKRK
jgi:ATP-dependent RNA helicase RhlE